MEGCSLTPRGFACSDSHRHKEGPSKLPDKGPGVGGSLRSSGGNWLLRRCGRCWLESESLQGEQAAGKLYLPFTSGSCSFGAGS